MRISDWSSDVCSSDLHRDGQQHERRHLLAPGPAQADGPPDRCPQEGGARLGPAAPLTLERAVPAVVDGAGHDRTIPARSRNTSSSEVRVGDMRCSGRPSSATASRTKERKRVVWGKGGSVRVDPGGSRLIKKKKKQNQ